MNNLTPLKKYKQDLGVGKIQSDSAQYAVVLLLEELHSALCKNEKSESVFSKLGEKLFKRSHSQKGLYLWGGVGRGKTYLMDAFFDTLTIKGKQRLHFHRFMHQLHHDLSLLQGIADPISKIAENIAKSTKIICFDEFFVSDITDAMLLGGLFDGLFQRGVMLVATSNVPPDKLYWNGLQRERFMPAIDQIIAHTSVVNLDSGIDYRLRTLEKAELFYCPHSSHAEQALSKNFDQLVTEELPVGSLLEVECRLISTVRVGEGVVWFKFSEICETPRSQNDYIEISRCYNTVMISEVPRLESKDEAAARRFISLVDEFYERRVKLMLTAEVELESIYNGQLLGFEFKRTLSRLQEMQSLSYLAEEHLA